MVAWGPFLQTESMLQQRVAFRSIHHRATGAAWVVLALVATLTGLSSDNEVYRLPIASAAAIMVTVFGTFALSDLRPLTLIVVGLVAAVLLDATPIRPFEAN